MLTVTTDDLQALLAAFGVYEPIAQTEELLRYDYEDDPSGKRVRLMLRCLFADGTALVVKLRNEADVTEELLSEQICFSEHLSARGVPTAGFYTADGAYVTGRTLHGYEVLVTVETFRPGEITCVTPEIARRTGRLLARTHGIAQRDRCRVNGPVLFDFFGRNELFSYESFEKQKSGLTGEDLLCWQRIEAAYRRRMDALASLRGRERYAVQGDISNCNLFMTEGGEIGLFDFNRCGDNILFCDAVMQGVFESRLMDYGCEWTESYAETLFARFLEGYHLEKPFSDAEISMIPHLYAVITAFWMDRGGISPLHAIEERIQRDLPVALSGCTRL